MPSTMIHVAKMLPGARTGPLCHPARVAGRKGYGSGACGSHLTPSCLQCRQCRCATSQVSGLPSCAQSTPHLWTDESKAFCGVKPARTGHQFMASGTSCGNIIVPPQASSRMIVPEMLHMTVLSRSLVERCHFTSLQQWLLLQESAPSR